MENPCNNLPNGQISIETNDLDLKISMNGEAYTNTLNYSELDQGVYEIVIMDTYGCTTLDVIELINRPPLEVKWNLPETDCNNEAVVLEPKIVSHFGPISFTWSDASTTSTLTARRSDVYSVTISDACDEKVLSTDLEIFLNDTLQKSDIPNVFTPNNDGVNDCFSPFLHLNDEIQNVELTIFDRWGNLVFSSNSVDACWDGKHQEVDAVPGVYVYLIRLELIKCNAITSQRFIGDVTVVR